MHKTNNLHLGVQFCTGVLLSAWAISDNAPIVKAI